MVAVKFKRDGEYFTCYIPEYDIYFSINQNKGIDGMMKRAENMVKSKKKFVALFGE